MKGADRVTVDAPRVLYLVTSGAPAPEGLAALVTHIQKSGWRVVVSGAGPRFSIPALELMLEESIRTEVTVIRRLGRKKSQVLRQGCSALMWKGSVQNNGFE